MVALLERMDALGLHEAVKTVDGVSDHLFSSFPTASVTASSPLSSLQSEENVPVEPGFDVYSLPRVPYVVGFTMTALRHEPPEPFGFGYATPPPKQHPDCKKISHEEICFRHTLLPGYVNPENFRSLSITSTIRIGNARGPQIVVVNNTLVAKIYDPLFFDAEDCSDVVCEADREYSCEAAAYTHLQKCPEVLDLIPSFHGSWTINIETAVTIGDESKLYSRSVRLILLEHLHGSCMLSCAVHELPEHVRTTILKQCLDAEIRILHAGVDHDDFCPRNIIFVGSDYSTPCIQVKVIDFDASFVYAHPRYRHQKYALEKKEFEKKWAPKLTSPMHRYFRRIDDFSFRGWCSYEEGNEDWGGEYWLWDNFGKDDRYIPVVWDPENPNVRPRYVDEPEEEDHFNFDQGDTDIC
jgi:hypothetical protein